MNLTTTKVILGACAVLLLNSGCTSGEEKRGDEPTKMDITKRLNFKVPSFTKVKDVQIEVSFNEGSKVEPHFKSRFNGKLEFNEPLYKTQKRILSKHVLEEIVKKGDEIKFYGVSDSTLEMGEWVVEISKFEASKINGKPITNWEVGSYVMSGSDKEKDLLKSEKLKKDEQKAKDKALRAENAEREKEEYARQQKIKEEKRKRETEELELREKLEADKKARKKLEADKLAKDAEKKTQMIRVATRAVTGEWKGQFICSEYGGASNMRLEISPLANKLTGSLAFVSQNGKSSGTISVAGEVDENGKLTLQPQGWIGKYKGGRYLTKLFGISGTLNATGSQLVGNVIDPSKRHGCTVFQIHRVQ